MSGEMLFDRNVRREDQSPRIDAGSCCFAMKIALLVHRGLEQPQHAVRHGIEQPHPQGEYVRKDLVRVVEAAEDEASFGQSALFS